MHTTQAPAGKCGARTRGGATCKRPRGWGTDHPGYGNCKNHGGSTPSGRKAAAEEAAKLSSRGLGVSLDIEPQDALLQCVQRTAGIALFCRQQVDALEADKLVENGSHGRVEMNVWIRAEAEATERLARFSKMALDAGVAERRVRLAERTAQLIAQALEDTLQELDLPAAHRAKLARTFGTRLMVLEASTGDVVEGTVAA